MTTLKICGWKLRGAVVRPVPGTAVPGYRLFRPSDSGGIPLKPDRGIGVGVLDVGTVQSELNLIGHEFHMAQR